MKRTLVILAIVAVALAAGGFVLYRQILAHGDPGYLIIGMGRWSLETSLLFAIGVLILAFIAFYLTLRLIANALRLPKLIKQRLREKRGKLSQEALIAGLLESAEGNWESAEKHLIRYAANSGVPLINYLTAARAAHSRGALEQRDEYLRLAQETMPDAELAIGLTKAELQLSQQQFEEALENLTQLERIAPSHAAILKLKHQAYVQAEDWEGLSRLLPQLHTNKVLMEAEIKLLEVETYSGLLKKRAEEGDPERLKALWEEQIPEHIRRMTGIRQLYFAAMIETGAGPSIEPQLRQALDEEWNATLVVLYGCIPMSNPEEQLKTAEQAWLPQHAEDAVCQRVLGKLALRAGHLEQAAYYLATSLAIEPSLEAYQLMGDLLLQQNDAAQAAHYFRKGLLFASNEVVAQIENHPQGDDEGSQSDEENTLSPQPALEDEQPHKTDAPSPLG